MSTKLLLDVDACVFDAYGTLFDFNSWLRGLAGHHADFWQVTGEALEFALATLNLERPGLHERLMNLYLQLATYPEVPEALRRLKLTGRKLAILSNGTPAMLEAVVNSAGLHRMFDAVLSVEEVGVYKPHPSVYGLACDRLELAPSRVCFLSSNAWDAFSAKAFGMRVVWCNRFGQAPERIPATPDGEISELGALPDLLAPVPG